MRNAVRIMVHYGCLPILFIAALLVSQPARLGAMGMGWGDEPEPPVETESCTPEPVPVLRPGPLGSPVRIVPVDNDSYLVADYAKRQIFKIVSSGPPQNFLELEGRPLSVLVSAPANKPQRGPGGNARRADRRTYYYVGNDDDRTIDVYLETRNKLHFKDKLFEGEPGVQALDMVYDDRANRILIVDGLTRNIKVLNLKLLHAGAEVFGGPGLLGDPKAMAFDALTGELFVSDYGDSGMGLGPAIRVFDRSGSLARTITGPFSRPQGLTVTTDRIYLVDAIQAKVLELDRATGSTVASHGCMGSAPDHLMLPMDVTLDPAGESLHVADNRNMRITILPLPVQQEGGQP